MRSILVLTCSGVSFAHGSNDGQKSIGLIMLTIIGLFPATYALNPQSTTSPQEIATLMHQAVALIQAHGDDRKSEVLGRIEPHASDADRAPSPSAAPVDAARSAQ